MTDKTSTLCITEIPFGLPGKIYRSPMPFGAYDPAGKAIEEFRDNRVSTVVMVLNPIFKMIDNLRERYTQEGLQVIFLPTYPGIPKEKDLREVLSTIIKQANEGKNIAVHCYAGVGRTGFVMACLAKEILGLSGDKAIEFVRKYIPGALETPDQVEMARKYKNAIRI